MLFSCKKVRPDNAKTAKFLEKKKKIYLVTVWARAGVQDFYFEKFDKKTGEPLVWQYDDKNGTCDNWYLRPIHMTTCCPEQLEWSFNEAEAWAAAYVYNFQHNL